MLSLVVSYVVAFRLIHVVLLEIQQSSQESQQWVRRHRCWVAFVYLSSLSRFQSLGALRIQLHVRDQCSSRVFGLLLPMRPQYFHFVCGSGAVFQHILQDLPILSLSVVLLKQGTDGSSGTLDWIVTLNGLIDIQTVGRIKMVISCATNPFCAAALVA